MLGSDSDSDEPLLHKAKADSVGDVEMPPLRLRPQPQAGCGNATLWISIGVAVPSSAAATFYNNWLLVEAPYPLLVTLAQLLVLLVCTQVARHTTGLFTAVGLAKDMPWGPYILQLSLVSAALTYSLVLSNVALANIPLSAIRMLGSSRLLWFGIGMLFYGYEPSARSLSIHVAVCAAALVLVCLSSANGGPSGVGIASQIGSDVLGSLVCLAAATCLTKGLGRQASPSTHGPGGPPVLLSMPVVVCHAAPMACVMCFFTWAVAESYDTDWEQVYRVGLPAFVINGFLGFAALLCNAVVAQLAPLPVISLASSATDAIVATGGVAILSEKICWGGIVGMVLGWASSFLYRRSREEPVVQEKGSAVRYARGEWVPQDQVPSMAETGDIVLFTSTPSFTPKGIGSAFVRLGTFATYDHVGLVFKNGGQVFLIESLAEGVSVSQWHHFLEQGWHKDYSRVVLRKLSWPAGGRAGQGGTSFGLRGRATLEAFAEGVKGKSYGLNLCALVCGGSSKGWNDAGRTYFCSEIVAEGYKFLGLLPPKACAARYVPGDFAEGRYLGLPHGASLGSELKIYFPGRWEGFDQAVEFGLRCF